MVNCLKGEHANFSFTKNFIASIECSISDRVEDISPEKVSVGDF
jgi:hypothetical protein